VAAGRRLAPPLLPRLNKKFWPVKTGPKAHSVAFDMLTTPAQQLFQPAVTQAAEDLEAGTAPHHGGGQLRRHMKQAKRREGRFGITIGKEHRSSSARSTWPSASSAPGCCGASSPRTHQRDGASEITPAIRDIVDAACRKLVSLEVASELYSVPQRYILGAAESDFVDSEGNPKTAWQTYITHILALTGDEEGEAPTVGQFVTYDPSVYTKVLDWYASAIAGMIGATPQDLGLYTQGNPPSADAVKFVEGRRDRKARRKQALFGGALVRAMQMAVRFDAGGDLPASMRRMEVDWMDPSTPTPGATTDALTKQIAAKMVPPTSDVVLKRAGYSGVERQRLAEDRVAVQGDEELLAITDALKGAGQKPAPAADDNQPAPAAPPQQ
jgi:hypothetical protein